MKGRRSRAAVLALLLAIAMASSCRLSVAAHDRDGESSSSSNSASIPAILGRDLRGFIARAGNMFRSDGGVGAWRAANVTAEAKNLRAVAASRRRRPAPRKSSGGGSRSSSARCISVAACRKRRVICGKRCYDVASSSRGAGLNHVPSRCVVKCRKCVPTC